MTTTEQATARIFVASPTNPTAGEWVDLDADMDAGDIWGVIDSVCEEYGHEEYLLADYEGLPGQLVGDYGGADIDGIAAFLSLLERTDVDVAREFVSLYGREYDPGEWHRAIDDHFIGAYPSKDEYAWARAEMYDTGDLPERYIDTDAMVRDMEASGEITFIELDPRRVAVFANY